VVAWLSMPEALPIVLSIGVALGFGAAAIAQRWNRRVRRCPACLVALQPLRETRDAQPLYGYDVYACTRCTNAFTAMIGHRHRFAHCPDCHQRTLETPCIRVADGSEGQRRVEVHESCHLCGHHATREVSDLPYLSPPKRGQIVPFRPRDKDQPSSP
jgi:hypothetical protein